MPEAPLRQSAPQQGPAQQAEAQTDTDQQAGPDEELPPWVTEFSDDTASAQAAPSEAAAAPGPAAVAARPAPKSAQPPRPYVIVPVSGLDWDGNWPAVAAALPLRGVVQQLATQAELIECLHDGHSTVFRLRVPIDTWRAGGNIEKLTVALSERFGRKVTLETELGPVWYTASAEAQAHREACQRQAEETIGNDPFVQSMLRDFDAMIVPGSITPAPATTTLH